MPKEKVFIVMSHKHSLKVGTKDQWEVSETVEFVNQLRNKHLTMSSAIGNYLDRTMQTGARHGINDYAQFEAYVRTKYESAMTKLDELYSDNRVAEPVSEPTEVLVTDQFGNERPHTVFDVVV